MPRRATELDALGTVVAHKGGFRARAQYRDEVGSPFAINGPWRSNKARAQADLVQMRAAGAVGKTREQGLEIMAAEARRIQVAAEYEAEQRAAALRERAAAAAAEAEEVKEEGLYYPASDSDPDNEPWLNYLNTIPLATTDRDDPFFVWLADLRWAHKGHFPCELRLDRPPARPKVL